MRNKYACVHGHFYQPPRENPWTGELEPEDSAHPYRDWNSRILEECYGPNLACPEADALGRIAGMVDHYRLISFNIGPTLAAWLERERPGFLERLRGSDQASARARGGHGNAVAQPYVHAILPLCDRRDKVTLVRWGKAEFRARFGRDPEGMWLPETAVDEETLEVLVQEGISFTILSPDQARRVRDPGAGEDGWKDVDSGTLLPTRPYRWISRLDPSRQIALFFYHDHLSRGVANEGPVSDGPTLARRIRGRFHPDDCVQLVHLACDGEYFGHHHRGQDATLGAALRFLEEEGGVQLTNHSQFLALFPPPQEADIHPRTAWSCSHGLGRWTEDCGCRGPGHETWSQAWRAPLREALEWLKAETDRLFEEEGAKLFKDPWAARDAYISRILAAPGVATDVRGPLDLGAAVPPPSTTGSGLDASIAATDDFLERNARRHLAPSEVSRALLLCELQRQRLLMFTSCGWFFDDISGLEGVQVLKHAACAADLAAGLGLPGLGAALRERLSKAKSNTVKFPDGGQVYSRLVEPQRVDLPRLAAHAALLAHLNPMGEEGAAPFLPPRFRTAARELGRAHKAGPARHDRAFSLWRIELRDELTARTWDGWAAVHQADRLDFACWLTAELPAEAKPPPEIVKSFETQDDESFRKFLDDSFGNFRFGLDAMLSEARLAATRRLILAPPGTAARQFLDRWANAAARLRRGEPRGDDALELLRDARTYGLTADQLPDIGAAREALARQLRGALEHPEPAALSRLVRWLEVFESAGIHVPLWELRDGFWQWRERLKVRADSAGSKPDDAERTFARSLGEKLGFSEAVWNHPGTP